MIARPPPPAHVALLALCLAGCGGEGAGVAFGLVTDMAVGFDVRRLEVTATVDGAVALTESLSYGQGELSLPAELLVQPAPDGAEVELSVEAFRDDGASPVVVRKAATLAAGGRTLLLPVSLDEACSGVACAAGATCVEGACVDPFVAPSALADHDPTWIISAPDACKTASSEGPAIVIGKGQSAFVPLRDGEAVPIEPGPQGGHHAWLALRVTGLRQMGSRLTAAGAFPDIEYELSPITSMVTLRKAGEGLCEIYGIRFQVDHGLPVDAVRGRALDVEISLEDPNGDRATATKRIVIAP